jgi:hypothetical protein
LEGILKALVKCSEGFRDKQFLPKKNEFHLDDVHHLGKCGDVMLPHQRRGWSRAYSMCSPVAASDRRAPYEELIGAADRREQMVAP